MNEKIFVIAGNHTEYKQYVKRKIEELVDQGMTISLSNFVYVHGPEVFCGFNEVHGAFVGSYKDRSDLRDIVREIKRINRLHPSETVVPGIFIGRGIMPNPTIIP